MRAALALFTALPVEWDGDDLDRSWLLAPVVGMLIGLVWFVFHQLTVGLVGPVVAGAFVVAISAALTGSRGFRGLVGLADAMGGAPAGPGAPPMVGVGALAVAIVVVVEANLIQRVNLAPAMIVIVPMVARGVQSLLLRAGDDMVGVTPPSPRAKLGIGMILLGLLALPIPLQSLVRPERLNGPLDVVGYLTLGVAALVGAFVVGGITRAWTMARFGPLDPRGWHAIGLFAEVAALVVVAVRID
ncbi:MAG: hypothetical protein ABGZ36_02235 [Actinomycetota bacterium]